MESISYTPPQEMAQMADPVNLPGAKSAKLIKNQKERKRFSFTNNFPWCLINKWKQDIAAGSRYQSNPALGLL